MQAHADTNGVATEFHGGVVPFGYSVWTVAFTDGTYTEELDVLAPLGSSPAQVQKLAEPIIAADYLPGMWIVDVSPFRGVTVWGAR